MPGIARRRNALLAVATLAGVVPLGLATPAGATGADPSAVGRFSPAFQEPGARCVQDKDGRSICKPAGASVVLLPNGKILYWDALEGMEDLRYTVVPQYGNVAQNDLVRVLDLRGGTPVWKVSDPTPVSNPKGNNNEYLPGGTYNNDEKRNDGDLFCSDQLFLADGTVLDVGGTSYYLEPGARTPVGTVGATELEGLKNSRLFDPSTGRWSAGGSMTYGRWYPSLVTLPDSSVFVASGVTKLIKPVYDRRPTDSGTNVVQPERFDPNTRTWKTYPSSADKSLPLYPRLHLLPDGKVYYDAAGQTFNPSGQSYDEATWNTASVFDPATARWSDVGLPEFDGVLKGFRGSGFSQMLPLRPDKDGAYRTARFLGAGGVYGVTPGTYAATSSAVVNTVTTDGKGGDSFASTVVAPMHAARWYGTGVTLPTGQVLVFSGADRDEVVLPGSGTPERTPEMFDPATGTWTVLADQAHGRTYHNTAMLLGDGRVLVGGHAPIATGYGNQMPQGTAAGLSSPYRDPSFEIFSPPNLFYGPRPVITQVSPDVTRGATLRIQTPDAADASSVTIVRNTAITHLVDGDQRVVELPIVRRDGQSLEVRVPQASAVLPDGPYNLFVNKRYAKGETPSVARQVFVGKTPAGLRDDVAANNTRTVQGELAARRARTPAPGSTPQPAATSAQPGPSSAAEVSSTRASRTLAATGTPLALPGLGFAGLALAALARHRRPRPR